jgi:hypothetical protein
MRLSNLHALTPNLSYRQGIAWGETAKFYSRDPKILDMDKITLVTDTSSPTIKRNLKN